MANRIFTKDEQEVLNKNPNVLSCSDKYITFTDNFKRLAVSKYQEKGLPPRIIFEEAGFDIKIIGNETAQNAIVRWRKQLSSGKEPQKKGRKKSLYTPGEMTDKERIAYLEAKVDYLESLHSFLTERQARK